MDPDSIEYPRLVKLINPNCVDLFSTEYIQLGSCLLTFLT